MLEKHSTKVLHPHHRYQLEVVFLFASGVFLLVPFLVFLHEYKLSVTEYQWYFFWPWMLFYSGYSLMTRAKILPAERIPPLKRPIILWTMFAVVISAYITSPPNTESLDSITFAFSIFSLFLADSYWDFRNPQKDI